jgi:hypothetical protein
MGTWIHVVRALPLAASALVLSACGSTSSSTSINPNAPTGSRCSVTATAQPAAVGAPGGAGSIVVSANRECAWEATSESEWLTLGSSRTGQGDGTVPFAAGVNALVADRRGAIVVNGTRVEIGQAAAACAFALDRSGRAVEAAGGRHDVGVSAQGGCSWTARSNTPWITVVSGASGVGAGAVALSVAANASLQARSGTVTIAGQTYTVDQAAATPGDGGGGTEPPTDPGCAYTVTPRSGSFTADGGSLEVAVTTSTPTCGWTAVSASPWISLVGGVSETGTGGRRFVVERNATPDTRVGIVHVAGVAITVTQAGANLPPTPCTFTVAPTTASLPAEGGSGQVTVTASAPTCGWTAASNDGWITIQGAAGGTGNGPLAFAVAPNPSTSPRAGSVRVAGTTVSVTQAGASTPTPCTFTVAPTTAAVPAEGGPGQVTVTASASTCTWAAASNDGWITIQGAAGGTGSGPIAFAAAANTSPSPRTGSLTVAGTTVTVTQPAAAPPPCTYAITPNPVNVGFAGDNDIYLHVVTTAGCAWTATSQASWITVPRGASGSGDGHAHIAVAATLLANGRTGTLLIGGQTVTVNQAGILNQEVTIEGTIDGLAGTCPNRTFTINGTSVTTNGATDFRRDGECSELRNGRTARIRGRGQADGSILANRVDHIEGLLAVREEE